MRRSLIHAFQRGMAGLAETRGNTADTFWTWRDTMYRFALEMTPEAFERFLQKGLTYSGKVTVTRAAKHVKVVVYDAGADLVGSAAVKIK